MKNNLFILRVTLALFSLIILISIIYITQFYLENNRVSDDQKSKGITNESHIVSDEYITKKKSDSNGEVYGSGQFPSFDSNQELGDWVRAESPNFAYDYWNDLYTKNKASELQIASRALAVTLRKEDSNAVYEDIKNRINDLDESPDRKEWLIFILGRAATPEGVDILVNEILDNPQHPLKEQLLKATEDSSKWRWDEKFHVEISPILEDAWLQSEDDSTIKTITKSIAKIGSPDAVALLFDYAEKNNDDTKSRAIKGSIYEIRNPETIPYLSLKLLNSPPNSTLFYLSGETLADMGNVKATEVLLNLRKITSDDSVEIIDEWLRRARDPDSIKLLENNSYKLDI